MKRYKASNKHVKYFYKDRTVDKSRSLNLMKLRQLECNQRINEVGWTHHQVRIVRLLSLNWLDDTVWLPGNIWSCSTDV